MPWTMSRCPGETKNIPMLESTKEKKTLWTLNIVSSWQEPIDKTKMCSNPSYFRAARSKSCRASPEIWACRPGSACTQSVFSAKVTALFRPVQSWERLDAELEVWNWNFAFFNHAENDFHKRLKATRHSCELLLSQKRWRFGRLNSLKNRKHVDLIFQPLMHPSHLSNPSNLLPCLEQKLFAHTQFAA